MFICTHKFLKFLYHELTLTDVTITINRCYDYDCAATNEWHVYKYQTIGQLKVFKILDFLYQFKHTKSFSLIRGKFSVPYVEFFQ